MADAPTRISTQHRIEGTLRAAEDVAFAGRLRGRLESDHALTIEAEGVLEADVVARAVVVHGVLVGNVEAAEDCVVEATGRVKGNIKAGRLILKAGGRVAGEVQTGAEVRLPRGLGEAAAGTRRPAGWSAAPASRPSRGASSPARHETVEPPAGGEVVETAPQAEPQTTA